jgi:hypothetical protein
MTSQTTPENPQRPTTASSPASTAVPGLAAPVAGAHQSTDQMATEEPFTTTGAQDRPAVIAGPDETAVAVADAADAQAGSTEHFTVSYDAALGPVGPAAGAPVLATVERDYLLLADMFGDLTPAGLPFAVTLTTQTGAAHASCTATALSVGATGSTDFTRSLIVAEADEVFMASRGWDCGASTGEGLSRVLANDLYPGAEPPNWLPAAWLDGSRQDWVTTTNPTDQNSASTGCSVLFLNWLHFGLGYPWREITAAGAATLTEVYSTLTGADDAWARFSADIAARFPAGTPAPTGWQNPYPTGWLFFYDQTHGAGAVTHRTAQNSLHTDWSLNPGAPSDIVDSPGSAGLRIDVLL